MEEDKLKDIFEAYRPELTSDSLFAARLQRNLDSVEIVRRRQAEMRRRGRLAVAVAAATGFVVGALLSLLLPYLGDYVTSIHFSTPGFDEVMFNWRLFGWCAVGFASVLTSLNAYHLTLARHRF